MSVRVMTLVWERSEEKGVRLLALLAIADNANDEGFAWPSQEYLAVKTRQSDRNIRRILDALVHHGELSLEERGSFGRSNRYRVNLEVLEEKASGLSALRVAKADIQGSPEDSGGQLGLLSGGQQVSGIGGQQVSAEPSKEPSGREPSKEELQVEKIAAVWAAWESTFEGKTRFGLTPARSTLLKKALNAIEWDLDTALSAIRGFKSWLDKNPSRNQKADIARVFATNMNDNKSLTDKILGWAEEDGGQNASASDPLASVPEVQRPVVRERMYLANRFIQGRPLDESGVADAKEAIEWLHSNHGLVGTLTEEKTVKWEKR